MKKIIIGLLSIILSCNFTLSIYAQNNEEETYEDSYEDTIGNVAGYLQTSISTTKNIRYESRFYENPTGGHGFAAESANNLNDLFKGKNGKVVGSDNIKDGADRIIKKRNGTIIQIQDKYYSTASNSVNAAFSEEGNYRYYISDNSPMMLEVPSDQYDDAVKLFAKKIEQGQVPGVTDPNEASNIVKKGSVTYEQAVNITKAGNIDSLIYDAKNGAIISTISMGISFTMDFVLSTLNGNSVEESLKSASLSSLKTGVLTEVIYVLSSQLAKTNAANVFTPISSNLASVLGKNTSDTLVTLFASNGTKTTTGAVTKVLNSQLLVSAVVLTVMATPDVVDCFKGRISAQQLAINLATLIGGMAGGTVGTIAGGALGNLVVPGAGTTIGAIAGGTAGGIAGSWGTSTLLSTVFTTDAEDMYEIILNKFTSLADSYVITQSEADDLTQQLQSKLQEETLKDMYESDDRDTFANKLLTPLFEKTVKSRKKVTVPTELEVRKSLSNQLSDVVYIH